MSLYFSGSLRAIMAAEARPFPRKFGSAPCLSSNSATFTWFSIVASASGVRQTGSSRCTGAFALSRSFATSTWPSCAAKCRGIQRVMSAALTSAPASSSAAAVSALPVSAALCRAVLVSSSTASIGALASSSIFTAGRNFTFFTELFFISFPWAARCKAVQPHSFAAWTRPGSLPRRRAMDSILPWPAANSSGVDCVPSGIFRSAPPCSISTLTTSGLPSSTALCSAVCWFASRALTSQPPTRSSSASSPWSSAQAMWSGVCILRSLALTWQPLEMSSCVRRRCPAMAAIWSPEEPSASSLPESRSLAFSGFSSSTATTFSMSPRRQRCARLSLTLSSSRCMRFTT
mmetsp:Transcript_63432/g.185468  ORF Transcript_63432/g.185468 Transcript_63432/m.185468 type:complete len:346 (+) Transcript_63432:135-1172(+)